MTAVPVRVAIARIIDPTACKVDRDGFPVEQVHSGEALMKADAILELQEGRNNALTAALRALLDNLHDVGGWPRVQAEPGSKLDAAYDVALAILSGAAV